jgi:hypothetical protein
MLHVSNVPLVLVTNRAELTRLPSRDDPVYKRGFEDGKKSLTGLKSLLLVIGSSGKRRGDCGQQRNRRAEELETHGGESRWCVADYRMNRISRPLSFRLFWWWCLLEMMNKLMRMVFELPSVEIAMTLYTLEGLKSR